jgi:hypothetical protein
MPVRRFPLTSKTCANQPRGRMLAGWRTRRPRGRRCERSVRTAQFEATGAICDGCASEEGRHAAWGGITAARRSVAVLRSSHVRLLHNTVELGQLIQEQRAEMGQRHLARPGSLAAADQRRQRGGMVAVAERPADDQAPVAERPATECTMLTSSASGTMSLPGPGSVAP